MMTRRTQAHEFWYIPKRVLKEPLAGCSKKIQMRGAQKYKDESGNLKAEFIFQFS
jgi:hypothetical protein